MQSVANMESSRVRCDPVAEILASPPLSDLRVAIRPDDVRNGLGKLVLVIVELVRQLLEKQAVRRVEAGSLSDDEIERLGLTFLQLGEQVTRLREYFGLEESDLNLDLGPLGKLL